MRRSPMPDRKTPLTSSQPLERKTAWNGSPQARSRLHAGQAARRNAKPARRRDTGPSKAVVLQVAQRDEWSCVRCGGSCHGERGRDWSVQHRRARGMGGTRKPDTNEPQNLILLCGSATSPGGCHLRVEQRLPADRDDGWAIRQSDDPLLVPVVHWQRGLIFLNRDGSWSSRSLTAEEATQ